MGTRDAELVTSPARRRVDPRIAQTERAVIAAAVALIAEHGPAGVTVEAVAARSGVARSTVYRRWGEPEELFAAAFDVVTRPAAAPPPTGDLAADLAAFAAAYAAELNDDGVFSVLVYLMDASLRSRRYRARYRAVTAARRRRVAAIVRRAVAAGDAPTDLDPVTLADAVMAPLFHTRVARHRPVEDAEVAAAVHDALTDAGLAPARPTRRRRPR